MLQSVLHPDERTTDRDVDDGFSDDDVKRLRQQYRVSQIMNPKMRGWCLARLLLDAKRQADDAVRAPHGSPTRSRTISADSALAPRASILTAEMPRRTTLFAGTRALPVAHAAHAASSHATHL